MTSVMALGGVSSFLRLKDVTTKYGSLYVTLCFVLCRFYFGVLTFYFRILSFLFICSVYDVVHFKRRI